MKIRILCEAKRVCLCAYRKAAREVAKYETHQRRGRNARQC